MFINEQIRVQLAQKILEAQDSLTYAKSRLQNLQNEHDSVFKSFATNVMPKKIYDFS